VALCLRSLVHVATNDVTEVASYKRIEYTCISSIDLLVPLLWILTKLIDP